MKHSYLSVFLLIYADASGLTQGWNSPASATVIGAGQPDWSGGKGAGNPAYAVSSNNQYAISTTGNSVMRTNWLRVTDFGFSIPAGAIIDGITVEVEISKVQVMGVPNVYNDSVYLLKAGAQAGVPKFNGASWPLADTYRSFGGCADLWGAAWTPAQINAPDFGVDFSTLLSAVGFQEVDARIDHIRITVCYSPSLPVELVNFSAFLAERHGTVKLAWQTASETNSNYFDVERYVSPSGGGVGGGWGWETIGRVKGAGNSTIAQHYTFIDDISQLAPTRIYFGTGGYQHIGTSANYFYYRLRQEDDDGKYSYSPVVSVQPEQPPLFEFTGLYVNAASGILHIGFRLPETGTPVPVVLLYNMAGRKVLEMPLSPLNAGLHEELINISSLGKGIYYAGLQWNGKLYGKEVLIY